MRRRRAWPPLTQEALAEKAGISLTYYQRLERGRASNPSMETLVRIGVALDLAPAAIDQLVQFATRAQADASDEWEPGHIRFSAAEIDREETLFYASGEVAADYRQRLSELTADIKRAVEMVAPNRKGLLNDITAVIRAEKINIRVAYCEDHGAEAICVFALDIANDAQWNRLKARLEAAIPGATVRRR
jgi:transcriptional regulator with XRE-family HTH domain